MGGGAGLAKGIDARAVLACHRCPWRGDLISLYACPSCGSSLLVDYEGSVGMPEALSTGGMWCYGRHLPVSSGTVPVSLGEGGTPLLRAPGLDPSGRLYLKNESANPTASFKDRPVSVAATVARELGLAGLLCASTGNTAVAVAAYAARAGLPAACVVPERTPAAKLRQIEVTGARTIRVRGDYSDAFALARTGAESYGWSNLTSTYINPYMLEGDKTVAYEVFEQLGDRLPDWVLVPVGAGPLLWSMHRGFGDLGTSGGPRPRMVAVQAEGCAPIARAFASGAESVEAWAEPVETRASSIADALRGYPQDGTRTLSAVYESEGAAVAVPEGETYRAIRDLAASEGLFVEPGAAVVVAAYRRMVAEGTIGDGESVVLVLTGHGLKDPDALGSAAGGEGSVPVEPGDVEAMGAALEGRP